MLQRGLITGVQKAPILDLNEFLVVIFFIYCYVMLKMKDLAAVC